MMNFKSLKPKRGFSFIEVLISLTIVGIMVGSLLGLNGAIFRTTYSAHDTIDKVVLLKNFFWQSRQDNKEIKAGKKIEKQVEENKTKLSYSIEKIKDNSVINKQKVNTKNLFLEKSEVEWSGGFGTKRKEGLFTFVFKQEEQKNEKV